VTPLENPRTSSFFAGFLQRWWLQLCGDAAMLLVALVVLATRVWIISTTPRLFKGFRAALVLCDSAAILGTAVVRWHGGLLLVACSVVVALV